VLEEPVAWVATLGALVAGWFLGRGLRSMFREHDIATKHIKAAHQREMFAIANEERETLEKALKSAPYPPTPMKPHESPWDWTRRAADMGYLKLKPWEPSWNYLRKHEETHVSVTATISVKVWTANIDGLLHRVGRLPMASGSSMPVLLCDTTTRVDTPIVEYDRERCPLITCLQCVVKVKD
jgi:hypothetical protein